VPASFGAVASTIPEDIDMTQKFGTPNQQASIDRFWSLPTLESAGLAGAASHGGREIGEWAPVQSAVPFPEETVKPFIKSANKFYKDYDAAQKAAAQSPAIANTPVPEPPALSSPIPQAAPLLPPPDANPAPSPTTVAKARRRLTKAKKQLEQTPDISGDDPRFKLPSWDDVSEQSRGGTASHAQRIARAWGGPAFGGSPYTSWMERHEALNMQRGPIHTGPIVSAVPGRSDRHNIQVPSGSARRRHGSK
jgi:hypothetical protein